MLWIRDILVWFWIFGSVPLTYGSGSLHLHQSSKIKSHEEVTKQSKSSFSYFFCLKIGRIRILKKITDLDLDPGGPKPYRCGSTKLTGTGRLTLWLAGKSAAKIWLTIELWEAFTKLQLWRQIIYSLTVDVYPGENLTNFIFSSRLSSTCLNCCTLFN